METQIVLNGEGIQHTQSLDIRVSVVATVNIDAQTAKRQVTAWLVSEVANMLVGGVPHLVISQQTLWQVPVLLTSSQVGIVGEVGIIAVDAQSGKLFVDDNIREEILNNAQRLIGLTPQSIS